MNFELTPQQKAVQQSARQFAQTVLQETVLEDDAAEVPAPASHPCLFIYHVKVAAIFKITAGYYMINRYTERNRREGLRLLLLPKNIRFPMGRNMSWSLLIMR